MNHFSVLLLDDDRPDVLDLANQEFPPDGEIRVRTAATKDEAIKLLLSHFFHLALIDPRLEKLPKNSAFEGFQVMRQLKELRPSCERVILTQLDRKEGKDAEQIASQLDPLDGLAKGMVTKIEGGFLRVIRGLAEEWMTNPVEVKGAEMVAGMLDARFKQRKEPTDTAITTDEIDFLVSQLFGQGQLWSRDFGGIGIDSVCLTPFTELGFSPSAVVKAQCFSKNNVPGIACVLKFAKRKYVEQELARYSQYVRYRLAVQHRVELLDSKFADNFGVLCYNFAGETSLTKQFLGKSEAFFDTLNRMFEPDQKNWYKEQHSVRLEPHFKPEPYKLNTPEVKGQIQTFVEEDLMKKFDGSKKDDVLHICGATLDLPRDALGNVLKKGVFQRVMPGCIVHGDLHCDNVLVDKDGRPLLIDYLTVNAGPRALDFATLESSIRLYSLRRLNDNETIVLDPRPDDEVIPELLKLRPVEQEIWDAVWGNAASAPDQPFWIRASIDLGKKAKKNFEDPPALNEEEYAATCLLWAMRLFKVRDMPDRDRARLLIWIDFLVSILNKQK